MTVEPITMIQLGLFADDEMTVNRTFASAHRIELDATSWVEHIPGWLSGSDRLFAALVASAGWEQRNRWMINRMVVEPRLTAEYTDLAKAPEPMLRKAAEYCPSTTGCPTTGSG